MLLLNHLCRLCIVHWCESLPTNQLQSEVQNDKPQSPLRHTCSLQIFRNCAHPVPRHYEPVRCSCESIPLLWHSNLLQSLHSPYTRQSL